MEEKRVCKVEQLDNNDILPNRFQPRKYFDEEEILQLAESIKEHGVINPVIVRRLGDKYELVAGERRYKANILAGNDDIPAIIMDVNDKESSEIAVVENIQRKDLNPVEEAISYKRSLDIGYMTQEQLAQKMGKSQSYIANKIRLLKLSDEVQDALMKKEISERHARSLLKLTSLKQQNELLKRIIDERLTVRKTDEEIEKMNDNINNSVGDVYNMNNNIIENSVKSPTLNINNISNIRENHIEQSIPIINNQPSSINDLNNLNNENQLSPNLNQNLENNNFINQGFIKEEKINPVIPEKTVSDINLESFDIPVTSSFIDQNLENKNFNVPQSASIEEEIISVQPVIPTSNMADVSLDLFNSTTPEININNNDNVNLGSRSYDKNIIVPTTAPIEEEITPIIQDESIPQNNLKPFDFSTLDIQPEVRQNPMLDNNDFLANTLTSENNSIPFSADNSEPSIVNVPVDESNFDINHNNSSDINYPGNEIDNDKDISFKPNLYSNDYDFNTTTAINSDIQKNSFGISHKEEPIFKTEPIIDTTLSNDVKNDAAILSDLDASIENNELENSGINNSYKPEIKPDPIIVNEYNHQYDPIMPDNSKNQPTIDFKSILSLIRKCSAAIENSGYKIETEEYNLDNLYQVVFKIEKQ